MKLFLLFFVGMLGFISTVKAQHEADNWYFGDSAGVTFKNGKPEPLQGSQMPYAQQGCATISDNITGELLFYTNGETVWNRHHQIMTNGTGLNGIAVDRHGTNWGAIQSALIVPTPGNKRQYYIFTTPVYDGTITGCYYSIVSLENSDGAVTTKNILLVDSVASKLTGTEDCSKTGFWVVTHHIRESTFYSFHVTSTGIEMTPVISIFNTPKNKYYGGYMKISPDKSKIASVATQGLTNEQNNTFSLLELFDFNASTGEITNYMQINDTQRYSGFTGIAFSPDGSKLYTNNTHRYSNPLSFSILQFDLKQKNETSIKNSVVNIPAGHSIESLQLAPDGKIYMATLGFKTLDAIDKPNLKDTICGYRDKVVAFPGRSRFGLPNFMEYNLRNITDTTQICSFGDARRIGPTQMSGYSYVWSPSAGLDNPTIANPLANPSQTTLYRLKIVNSLGCEDFQLHNVTVAERPKIDSVKPICSGESVTLNASGGGTYEWSPATGLSSPTSSRTDASPKKNTRYKVIVRNGSCIDSAFVTVDVINTYVFAGNDRTICSGESVQIGDSVFAKDVTYVWSPTEGLNDPHIPNPIATPSKTTVYTLEVNHLGCTAADKVIVTVQPKPIATISKDTVVCGKTPVQLSASGGTSYSWSPTAGLNNPNISKPLALPDTTTKYRVLVSKGNCMDSAFVTVTVTPFSGANAGSDKTVCPSQSTQLGDKSVANHKYEWQPTVNLDNPNSANPICAPSIGSTKYILKVTNAAGCIAYDTVLVTVGNIVAKVSADTTVCTGSSVQLSASGGSDYEWSPSTGLDNSKIPTPMATPTVTTTYKVRVSSGSCEDFDSVTVTVSPIPVANAGADLTACMGEPSVLGAPPQDGNTYQWQPTIGLDNPTKSNPIASPTVTTEYILTVTNSGGCTATDTVLVTVGNIKAIASGDTTICSGSSVRVSASGGTTYQWSPSTGLDNPNSANPLCTVNSTTSYTVIVSNGSCIDTAFVTVNIAPPPIAYAGQDMVICIGEQTTIGAPEITSNMYSWTPQTGLANPNASQTDASPFVNTEYILKVTNSSGCINYDTVLVTVNPANERVFTLSPSIIDILPGEQFSSSLYIPGGVQSWKVLLDYDNLVARFNSILRSSNGIMATALDTNSQLSISGKGGNGTVELGFSTFLPYNSDTTFAMKLTVDSAETALCETVAARGNILDLGVFCGRTIRTVSSTGKKFFLRNKDNGLNFGVGLSGKVRLELYDYTGTLKEILVDSGLEAGEYSIDFDLPTGMYFCRISAGMFEDVEKVIVVR